MTDDETRPPDHEVMYDPVRPPDPTLLYDPAIHLRDVFRVNLPRLADAEGLTATQLEEERRAFVQFVKDSGLAFGQAERLHNLSTEVRCAGATISDAELSERNIAARRRIRERFGQPVGEDLLDRADEFVRSSPVLMAMLQHGGLGSDVRIVDMLVEHVRRTNWQP